MRRHLVFGDAGFKEFHCFPMGRVADSTDDTHALVLVFIFDGPGFHHGRHAVDPFDAIFLEGLEHVDIDKVDAQFFAGDAEALHLFFDGIHEFVDLLGRSRARSAFDPRVGVTNVLWRNPRCVSLNLRTNIALFKQNGRTVTTKHGIAQTRFEPVPTRCQRAGDIAYVFVVHEQHRAQTMGFHALPRALGSIGPQPVPIDALLPIDTGNSEIRVTASRHLISPLVGAFV